MAIFNTSNSNNRFTLRLTVTETSTNAASNTSTLNYTLQLIANTSYHFSTYRIGYTVALNGATVDNVARTDSDYLSIASNGTLTLCSGTHTVTHSGDGTLTNMPVSFSIDMVSTDYTPGSLSGSGTMTLTTIPRASTIGATSANIGEVSTITVARQSTSFTHSIAYAFGSLSGYITSDGKTSTTEATFAVTSIAFSVPTEFYAQIPTAKSGKCTLTIKTYSGSTQIGSAHTCTFTATASQSVCAPNLTATAADTNSVSLAVTGSESKVLKGISNIQVTSTAIARNSASISSVTVVCGSSTKTGTSVTFTAAESATIKVTATDSRGYTTTVTVSGLALIDYSTPTLFASPKRETQTSDIVNCSVTGTWFNGNLGSKSNTLSATVKYKSSTSSYSSAQTITLTLSDNTYFGTLRLSGFDYQKAYTFYFMIEDAVGSTVTSTVDLTKGTSVADWGENDWAFNVPVVCNSSLAVDGLNVGGLLNAMTNCYSLTTTVSAASNWTISSVNSRLVGNNLRIYIDTSTRSSATDIGNVSNEEVCTLTIATDGKITDAQSVGFCPGLTGSVATFYATASVSDNMLTITIRLAATTTAMTQFNASFVVPCTLNLDAY